MISETEENFSGVVAAKMETGDFRALARGESARWGGNNEVWRKMEMGEKWKWLPVVKTGSLLMKTRYCSMVRFGGVDTGKYNIQEEKRREEKKKSG